MGANYCVNAPICSNSCVPFFCLFILFLFFFFASLVCVESSVLHCVKGFGTSACGWCERLTLHAPKDVGAEEGHDDDGERKCIVSQDLSLTRVQVWAANTTRTVQISALHRGPTQVFNVGLPHVPNTSRGNTQSVSLIKAASCGLSDISHRPMQGLNMN